MNLDLFSIDGSDHSISVEISEEFDAGAQGRVYRVTHLDDPNFCVKAMPGIVLGEIPQHTQVFADLTERVDAGIKSGRTTLATRASLLAFRKYLPTHVGYQKLPGISENCLLFFRRYCDGASLQQLTDPTAAEMPPFEWRSRTTTTLVRLLTTLDVYGFVHLDPYPDNIFVAGLGNNLPTEVSLIDLEGIGVIRSADDKLIRKPISYGKPGIWLLPNWFPTPGPRDYEYREIAGARWQMLCAILFTLTWGSVLPLAWLPHEVFQAVVTATKARDGRPLPTSLCDSLLLIDLEAEFQFEQILNRNSALKKTLKQWFVAGLQSHARLPTAVQMQTRLTKLLSVGAAQ